MFFPTWCFPPFLPPFCIVFMTLPTAAVNFRLLPPPPPPKKNHRERRGSLSLSSRGGRGSHCEERFMASGISKEGYQKSALFFHYQNLRHLGWIPIICENGPVVYAHQFRAFIAQRWWFQVLFLTFQCSFTLRKKDKSNTSSNATTGWLTEAEKLNVFKRDQCCRMA